MSWGQPRYLKLSRREVYEKVWSMPLREVAAHYGALYFDMRSACKEARVPLPPKGHWNKVRAGKPISRPLLPPDRYEMDRVHVRILDEVEEQKPAVVTPAYEPPSSRVHRRQLLPVVRQILDSRELGASDRVVSSSVVKAMHTAPISDAEMRAAHMLDWIARHLLERGFKLTPGYQMTLVVGHKDHPQSLRIRERWKKSLPSAGNRLYPSGLLEATLGGYRWSEKDAGQSLAPYLPSIVARIELSFRKIEELKQKEAQRQAELASRRASEEAEARETARREEFWQRAVRAARQREDVELVRTLLRDIVTGVSLVDEQEQAIQWLAREADLRDPMRNLQDWMCCNSGEKD